MSFGEKILRYQDDILRDLAELIRIPSVRSAPEPGMPFGRESARALETVLSMAERLGLEVKNVDNYAGHAEYGEGEETAAVLAHVDVVPAGEGWETDPYTMVIRDGCCFGRGTADDKGEAIVALYCLKALKEYGICNREKGRVSAVITGACADSVIRFFSAGTVANAVPARAEAVVACTAGQLEALRAAAAQQGERFTVEAMPEGARVCASGVAAHAMQPQEGVNAASHLVRLLASVFSPEELGGFFTFLDRCIGLEYDGTSMGVKQEDAESGPLTLNLGLVSAEDGKASLTIDIRFPVTGNGDEILAQIGRRVEEAGLVLADGHVVAPLFLPADSPFIRLLSDAYEAVMGVPAQLYATGGGTYARALQSRGVAFGPFFADEPDRRLHNVGEHFEITRFMQHAQICLEAMYRMLTA